MYYLLGHRLMELPISVDRKEVMAENTYLLTLDGDIDFQPHAVRLLIDLMKKNKNLGAACGRIHPVGSGKYPSIISKIHSLFILLNQVDILKFKKHFQNSHLFCLVVNTKCFRPNGVVSTVRIRDWSLAAKGDGTHDRMRAL